MDFMFWPGIGRKSWLLSWRFPPHLHQSRFILSSLSFQQIIISRLSSNMGWLLFPEKNFYIPIKVYQPQCTLILRLSLFIKQMGHIHTAHIFGTPPHTECEKRSSPQHVSFNTLYYLVVFICNSIAWLWGRIIFNHTGCIFSTEDSPHSMWGSMYSAKWLGETAFFFLTMSPIIQAHKHIVCMTHYTVWYVRQTQRRQWMLA